MGGRFWRNARAMQQHAASRPAPAPLLGPGDPPPFEVVNPDGRANLLLVCDHAGRAIPRALGMLGLDAADLDRHIACDIGAGDLTRALAARLDAPAVLAAYSRLVIDNNRRLDDATSIPEVSDGTPIPGNLELGTAEALRRAEEIFEPYHAEVRRRLAALEARGVFPPLIAIHSFTPVFEGHERPWHVGLLWDRDPRLPKPLLAALEANAGIVAGENVPYSARDPHGYTMLEHADSQGRANVLIEVRQDLIDTRRGVDDWTTLLGDALAEVLRTPALYRREAPA